MSRADPIGTGSVKLINFSSGSATSNQIKQAFLNNIVNTINRLQSSQDGVVWSPRPNRAWYFATLRFSNQVN